eukprot:1148514-Pelagomonas_calceolata.AAC.3
MAIACWNILAIDLKGGPNEDEARTQNLVFKAFVSFTSQLAVQTCKIYMHALASSAGGCMGRAVQEGPCSTGSLRCPMPGRSREWP